jgi:hypothetical protein
LDEVGNINELYKLDAFLEKANESEIDCYLKAVEKGRLEGFM